ncbi:hypothetical protein AAVH_37347, partial [Aphelenchoides avenae]
TLSGVFNWDSAYDACLDLGADLPSIHSDAENDAFAEVASYYPLVILGLKNNAIAPWSGSQVFDYQWTDGSFVNYSLLQFNDEETIYGHCACLQKGKAGKNHQWVAVDCLEPTEMATAVCQKSPKEA